MPPPPLPCSCPCFRPCAYVCASVCVCVCRSCGVSIRSCGVSFRSCGVCLPDACCPAAHRTLARELRAAHGRATSWRPWKAEQEGHACSSYLFTTRVMVPRPCRRGRGEARAAASLTLQRMLWCPAPAGGGGGERELRLGRLQRQKVRVSRKRILDSAVKVSVRACVRAGG